MTPAEAGFDGAKGIRLAMSNCPNYRVQLRRSKTKLPSECPDVDFTEQLIWLYPEGKPARLLWCNADNQWHELTFSPTQKP